jgi:hypothetical protein
MPVAKTPIALLLATALMAAACGSNDTPTTPAAPATSVVETFSGTLTPFSARTHVFSSNNAGDVIVQVTALDPSDTTVGLSVGTSNNFACQSSSVSTEQATINSSLSGVTTGAGTLCVHIYDPSDAGLAGPVTYTLQVTHF